MIIHQHDYVTPQCEYCSADFSTIVCESEFGSGIEDLGEEDWLK